MRRRRRRRTDAADDASAPTMTRGDDDDDDAAPTPETAAVGARPGAYAREKSSRFGQIQCRPNCGRVPAGSRSESGRPLASLSGNATEKEPAPTDTHIYIESFIRVGDQICMPVCYSHCSSIIAAGFRSESGEIAAGFRPESDEIMASSVAAIGSHDLTYFCLDSDASRTASELQPDCHRRVGERRSDEREWQR